MLANRKRYRFYLGTLLSFLTCCCFGQQAEVTVKFQNDNRTYYGLPLGWDGKQLALLRLDGRLSMLPANSGDTPEVVSKDFKPYSTTQLQTWLKKEFGKRYDVSTTPDFVVVHPWGKKEFWARPFEDFFQRFEYYFRSQGVTVSKSRFPLIVVVLRSRSDFDRYMDKDERIHNRHVAGYYSRKTNRIITFDPSQMLRTEKTSWLYESSTILHEAAHQSAFNLGLHNRFAPPPLWLAEGLAMLFEANGFNHSEKYTSQRERVNQKRYQVLRKYYAEKKAPFKLIDIIQDDAIFKSDPEQAYALAWAVTFYLVENNPDAYFDFLHHDAARKNFSTYPTNQRLKDFAEAFGPDIEQLEQSMKEFFLPEQRRN